MLLLGLQWTLRRTMPWMDVRKKNTTSSQTTSTGFRLEGVIIIFKSQLSISGHVRQDSNWACQDKGGGGKAEGRLWTISVWSRNVPREVWQMPGEPFVTKTLFIVQPFAETNTLLGSLLQLSYQGISVYSTEHCCCCCIEPWESCDLSPFTLSTSIYPLAMTHPSWDWLIDWFAHDDQLVGITHLSFGNAITRSVKSLAWFKLCNNPRWSWGKSQQKRKRLRYISTSFMRIYFLIEVWAHFWDKRPTKLL